MRRTSDCDSSNAPSLRQSPGSASLSEAIGTYIVRVFQYLQVHISQYGNGFKFGPSKGLVDLRKAYQVLHL